MRCEWLGALALLGALAVSLPLALRRSDPSLDGGGQSDRIALLESKLSEVIAAQTRHAEDLTGAKSSHTLRIQALEGEIASLREQLKVATAHAPTGPQGEKASRGAASPAPAVQALPPGAKSVLSIAAEVEKGNYVVLKNTEITSCSVQAAASSVWEPAQPAPEEPEEQPWPADARGAIATSWTGPNREQWICQWRTLQDYCAKHGYTLYPINDTAEWEEERLADKLGAHWLKVQVLRRLLLKHPWVLHMDVDAMFPDVSSSTSLEEAMGDAIKTKSLIVTERRQWNTDTVFIRSSAWGRRFVQNVWELRRVCPHCIGEQCALALEVWNNVILHHLDMRSADARSIPPYEGWSCCLPRALCEYPLRKDAGPRNALLPGGDRTNFWCVGSWMNEYFKSGVGNYAGSPTGSRPANEHPHILFWEGFRKAIGIRHPSKTRTSCECFKARVHNETPDQAYKSCRDWKR